MGELIVSTRPAGKTQCHITKPNDEQPNFTILASLPWTFGDPQCCIRFRAEIWKDEYDRIYVTYFQNWVQKREQDSEICSPPAMSSGLAVIGATTTAALICWAVASLWVKVFPR